MILDGLLTGEHLDAVYVVGYDRDHRPVAFQRYLPCAGGAALTLDTMRRESAAPNGVNERLIVEAIGWARRSGISHISLSFAAFRQLFEADRDLRERVEYWLVHRFDRFIKVESLYRFNAKFRPRWRPRHALYRSYAELPRVLLATIVVEFGGNRSPAAPSRPVGTTPPVGRPDRAVDPQAESIRPARSRAIGPVGG